MKINPARFREKGKLDGERLVFTVEQDDDIGSYAVFHTNFLKDGMVSSRVKRVYWFPDKPVRKGDLVVLYTKQGTQSEKKASDGSTSHFFYWGLTGALWDSPSECAVLTHIDSWADTSDIKDEEVKK